MPTGITVVNNAIMIDQHYREDVTALFINQTQAYSDHHDPTGVIMDSDDVMGERIALGSAMYAMQSVIRKVSVDAINAFIAATGQHDDLHLNIVSSETIRAYLEEKRNGGTTNPPT